MILCAMTFDTSIWVFLILLCRCFRYSISFPESISATIEKASKGIFPLQHVYIRKVKVLKKPKFDLVKLMELHAESAEDAGAAIDRPKNESNVQNIKGSGGRL